MVGSKDAFSLRYIFSGKTQNIGIGDDCGFSEFDLRLDSSEQGVVLIQRGMLKFNFEANSHKLLSVRSIILHDSFASNGDKHKLLVSKQAEQYSCPSVVSLDDQSSAEVEKQEE